MKKLKVCLLIGAVSLSTMACASAKKETSQTQAVNQPSVTIKEVNVDSIAASEEESEYSFAPAELICSIPDGFNESEYDGEYLYKTYPKDVSSINQVISESDEDPTLKTEEEFIAEMQKEYKSAYGEDVTINVTQYDNIVVDKRPGLWIMYNFDFRGEEYNVLMVILYNGTESNYITYLQGPGADWMEDFVNSAMSISLKDL